MPKVVKEKKVLLSAYVKPEYKEWLQILASKFGVSMGYILNEILDEALKPFIEGWDLSTLKVDLVKKMNELSSHIDNMGAKNPDFRLSIVKSINNLDDDKGGKNET